MSTFTKEQLLERAREKVKSLEFIVTQTAFADTRAELEEELELARIALASLEAEPVAWDYESASYITCEGPQKFKRIIEREAPPEWAIDEGRARNIVPLYSAPPAPVSVPDAMEMDDDFDSAFEHGKAVGWNAYRAAMLQSFGNSEQLNSPVIPDGWVLVPEEPTHEMLEAGDEQFGTYDVYRRMIAASPQQK